MSRWCEKFDILSTDVFIDASDRLLKYTPGATVVRLLTTNALIAYITSWVLYISGASEDPRMLLPAWVSIATVCLVNLVHQKGLLTSMDVIDSYNALSPFSTQDQYKKRNICVDQRLLHCKFYQYVLFTPTTPPYQGKRSGGAPICHHAERMELSCGAFSSPAR